MIPGIASWPDQTRPLLGGWVWSTSHALSSHGIPVLVAPTGEAFGPGDLLSIKDVAEMRGINLQTLGSYLNRRSPSAGPGWKRVGRSGWAILAADAVRV